MKKLKELRILSGLSLAQLSDRCGIDAARLCRAGEQGIIHFAPHEVYLVRRLLTFAIAERSGELEALLRECEKATDRSAVAVS